VKQTVTKNLTYQISKERLDWSLVIKLDSPLDNDHSGYLNLEADVLSLACPEDQIDAIENTFTPYYFESLEKLLHSVKIVEVKKEAIIHNYFINHES
jgi:hypothetical protein